MTEAGSGSLTTMDGQDIAVGSSKTTKAGRVRWVGEMNQTLLEGLTASAWLAHVESDQLAAGRQICMDLWPFILALPDNIKAVKDKLPDSLESAKLFLNNLADEERHYQELYLQQCELAGLSRSILTSGEIKASPATSTLVRVMHEACVDGDVVTGVQAIVAAELAATHFARAAKDFFENYFDRHADDYNPGEIDQGLEWLRLHAKTNTRHALWMNRMLVGLNQADDDGDLPETVKKIIQAIFALWNVNKTFKFKAKEKLSHN